MGRKKIESWSKYEDPESDVSDTDRLAYARYQTVLQVCYRYAGTPPIQEAAKAAGVSPALFRKLYYQGAGAKYKDFPNGGLAIRDVMKSITISARSKIDDANTDPTDEDIDGSSILSQLSKANRKALHDAIKSRAEEGKAIRVARANSATLLQYTHHLLKACGPLAQSIHEQVHSHTLDINTQLKVLKSISDFAKTSSDIQSSLAKMENETLGSLQDTLQTLIAGSDGIDEEEAMAIIDNAKAALDRARQDGAFADSTQEIQEELDSSEGAIISPKAVDEDAEEVQARPSLAIDAEVDDEEDQA